MSQVIRRKLLEASKNDAVLNMMMLGKSIILQKKDPDRENKECDLEDEEEVPDKSDVTVVLIPKPPIASSTTSLPIIIPGDLGVGEKAAVEMDLEVLYTEPPYSNPDEVIVIQKSLPDAPTVTNMVCYRDSGPLGINTNAAEDTEADSSGIGKIHSTSIESRKLPPSSGPGSIAQIASLPALTLDLEKKLADIGILQAQKYFIHHWGSYLWQATKTTPSKQDYFNLASSIVAAYPNLSGGQNGCGIVKSQLSIWIRNHRANLKKQVTKTCNQGKAKLIPVAQATMKPSESVTHTDVQNALKELKKKYVQGTNTSHLKKLLQVTLTARRPWIEKEALRIVDIVAKYPPLKDYEMIFYEFLSLKDRTEEVIFEQIDRLITKLANFFSMKEKNGKTKVLILTKLCEELSNKRIKQKAKEKNTYLFIVKEVMASMTDLNTGQEDAPRVVIYTSDDDIATAYIVADEDIRMKIPEPTVQKIVAGLLSAYFVWHRAYPAKYNNTLQYIEHELLGTLVKSTCTVVTKFIRKLDHV